MFGFNPRTFQQEDVPPHFHAIPDFKYECCDRIQPAEPDVYVYLLKLTSGREVHVLCMAVHFGSRFQITKLTGGFNDGQTDCKYIDSREVT